MFHAEGLQSCKKGVVLVMEFREVMNERTRLFIRLAVVTLGVYLSFRFILPLILPFIFAYFLAWVVRPSTEFLYKKAKIPRIIGGSISLLVLVFIVGSGLVYLGNLLIKQAVSFARNIPIYLNILAGKLDNICSSCDEILGLSVGSAREAVDDNILNMVDKVKTDVIPGMTAKTLNLSIAKRSKRIPAPPLCPYGSLARIYTIRYVDTQKMVLKIITFPKSNF